MFFARTTSVLALALASAATPSAAAPAGQPDQPQVRGIYRGVSTAVQFDVSPPLRSMTPLPVQPGRDRDEFENRDTGLELQPGPQGQDPVVQSAAGRARSPLRTSASTGPATSRACRRPTRSATWARATTWR